MRPLNSDDSDGVLGDMSLALASAPSRWPWSCAEKSSKFSRTCVSKGRTNAVKNFSKVAINESTQIPKLGDNLF